MKDIKGTAIVIMQEVTEPKCESILHFRNNA